MGKDSDLEEETYTDELCVDRISQLPDSLLCEILAYVPTKNAVATCILSARWKSLFPFGVPPIELDLDDSQLLHPENCESSTLTTSFSDFVTKLLNETLLNEPRVPFVNFKCRKRYSDAKFVSWVCAALQMNVKHLGLKFSTMSESRTLFDKLNGCTTLTRLELGEKFGLSIPDEFSLPNLKRLHLRGITFGEDDEGVMNKLMDGCPVVLDLSLSDCDLRLLGFICIRSRSLRKLRIQNSWEGSSCELVLNAPRLEVLILKKCFASDFVIYTRMKRLRWAFIDVGPCKLMELESDEGPWYYHWFHLVNACNGASQLHFNRWAIEALHDFSCVGLPTFLNLTTLSLGCILGSNGWGILAHLLCIAPNLEQLILEEEGLRECKDGYANFERFVPTVPVCLEMHMKEIEIRTFNGHEDEIKLMEYFLKNGKVLETLFLHCFPKNWNILRRLFELPRSEFSKIHFHMHENPVVEN